MMIIIGSTALRDYFKEEVKYQRDMQDCESVSDLPTFKDFEVTHTVAFVTLSLMKC